MTATLAFWVAFAALVFGAVCSTLHLSLRGLSRSKVEQLADRGSESLRERDLTPRTRKPLAEFVFGERYGEASPIANG